MLTFVFLCFVATIIGMITKNEMTKVFFSVYQSSLLNPLTYIRFIAHILGHLDFEHFMSNTIFLLLLGPMLEEKYGAKILIYVMMATALVTGVIHFIFNGSTMLCGASGIVFAYVILSSYTSFKDGEVPLSFILVTVLFIGKEIYSGITIQDNISNFTHILGGVVGGVSGYFLNKSKNEKRLFIK